MIDAEAVRGLIAQGLADPDATWSLGGFGALAEFGRAAGEPVTWLESERTGLFTPRGGILLEASGAMPVAYETAFAGDWSHAVALCVPRAQRRPPGRGIVTEAGCDAHAMRTENSGDNLFDLGLDLPQGCFALRTGDPANLSRLRGIVGREPFAPGGPVLDLIATSAVDLVVSTPLGRIEVFAGAGVGGPRGFLAPNLLRLGRTHAATAAIPEGLMPVATLHPAHPCRDAARNPRPFDPARHAAFQALHARWGDPDLVALKARLVTGLGLDRGEATRRTRNLARVVRIQAEVRGGDHDKSSPDTLR